MHVESRLTNGVRSRCKRTVEHWMTKNPDNLRLASPLRVFERTLQEADLDANHVYS